MSEQRVVLLLQQEGDGPHCKVRDIDKIEILCKDETSEFVIEHLSDIKSYLLIGAGMHLINIPEGVVKVRRVKGNSPATVYAWS